jgi:hypothetical protein
MEEEEGMGYKDILSIGDLVSPVPECTLIKVDIPKLN